MGLIGRFFGVSPLERQKLLISGALFFLLIASYSLVKELQNIIFGNMVGVTYAPIAKILTLFVLLPLSIIDGFLADRLKRYQILVVYLVGFSVIGFTFYYLLGVPRIGLENQVRDPYRILGWLFYVYIEGYPVLIFGVFWAFVNSIHKPQDAEHTYGFIVGWSKLGGLCSATFAYFMFCGGILVQLNDFEKVRLALIISSSLLIFGAIFLQVVCRRMDSKVFVGYHASRDERIKRTGAIEGLRVIFRQPYVVGIFLLIFCCEGLMEVVNYQRLLIVLTDKGMDSGVKSIGEAASTLYSHIIVMHLAGASLSFFVTNGLMRFLGTRIALFATPALCLLMVLIYFITMSDAVLISLYIALHALNYCVHTPIRESLYIITSRDIQLKSKFIVDVLGSKASRAVGQTFNLMVSRLVVNSNVHLIALANNIFFVVILGLWFFVATFVGIRYAEAKVGKEVIG